MAGGRGERLGGQPKQFRPLGGIPVLCWAVRPLLDGTSGEVVVVLPEGALEEGAELLGEYLEGSARRVRLAAGGARRQDSVRAGLGALERAGGAVVVHDGARPFASAALVERVAREAAGGKAVVPAIPTADTIKRVDEGRVVETIERRAAVAVQTPQGFPLAVLEAAHAAWPGDEEATDDAAMCERMGAPVAWVPGEALNRKLTGPEDWWWAERVVESGRVRWGGST
ncbi:MAG TPA: 2-C-methyl-D-erythritol 4-phosphate cytidylyltransferase [Gemmatimonadota bacterium]|nr:2-C-methyl-D-erythritol 4-phosphate cytidylyltransferase [Gemmatimonadota bacterium]